MTNIEISKEAGIRLEELTEMYLSDAVNSCISKPIRGESIADVITDVSKLFLQILLVIFGIAILYHFGNPHTKRFRLINAGTLFATIVIFLATKGLSIYFSNFNVYNKIYGSIGSLLITLVWLNIVSYVLIIGFELYTKASEIKKRYGKRV